MTLTFSRAGKVVARIETDDKGSYRVMLAPGNYFVLSVQPVRPQHVSVPSSGFRRIDFSIDTKIR